MAKVSLNTNSKRSLLYTGKEEYQPKPNEKDNGEILYPYIPVSKGLVEAVNLSINLNRPLLLEGEPGCGKTRLARAVAYEFGKQYNIEKWPYADWNIKSSDQARDGLYIYDAVRRLFDVQLFTVEHQLQNTNSANPLDKDNIRQRLEDPKHEAYIQWGALGKAFQASQKGQRMIVLIDEIDKADTDFPNDLLLELEEKRFFIKETGREIRAEPDFAPIIFITSNGQRKLPDAFLRRCLIFEEMFGEKVERSHPPTIHPPKEEQTASAIATPEEAPQKSTTTKKSRSKKPHFFFAPAPSSHSIESTTQETEVAKAVRVGKPRDWTAFKPSGLPKDYFPVTARQMEQGWYTLRRPIRKGLRLELDVPATIDQIKQRGMFFQPIQKPCQVKSSHLVLLIDQKGSMQPFHVLSRLLVETAYQTSCLEKTDCYYFNNYPRFMLYGDSQFQTESPVEDVMARWHPEKTVILILSDAGAARGNFVLRRVERTLEFLEKLQHYSKAIAWLNPVPQASWKRTTAQAIAEEKIVPMFPCDRVGFQKAMKVLQGISQLQVYQVTEEATTEEKDTFKAEPEADPDIEYAIKRINSFGRRFTQAHLDLAYHAAFPLTLTPDFLYRLRDYLIDLDLQIPWIAVSDLLLSGLCNEVGQELYEMNITVRQVLLKHLTQRYGQERLNKLSEFLLEYVARQVNHLDSGIIQAQTWTALAYVNTTEAAKQITLKLTKMLQQYNQSDWLQMTFLVETLTEPLKNEGFQPLLALAQGMEQSARGDLFGAEKQFDELRHQLGSSPTIAGVSISIPPPPIPAKSFSFDVVTVNAVGEIVQKESCKADYFKEDLGNSVTLEMVYIPEGTFLMGSPETEEGHMERESPQHEVTLQPFFIGKYPITQAQWRAIAALPQVKRELDPDPSRFKGDDLPVESVSWYDAVEFCDRLSLYTKRNYRLPSEAEWEYACRAGTTTPFHFGETIKPELANYDGSITYGSGSKGKSSEQTTPVGSFKIANAFGLFDMHGNVLEWFADNWHENYVNSPTDNSAWLSKGDNDNRMLSSGSWSSNPKHCRSACRNDVYADLRSPNIGFRVVVFGART